MKAFARHLETAVGKHGKPVFMGFPAAYDFGWLEDILAALGFRLVFCRRRPETFEAARARRLEVSGNPAQYDDLRPFIEEQERLARLVSASRLESLELDVSDDDVGRCAETIADWLERTGGLWAP